MQKQHTALLACFAFIANVQSQTPTTEEIQQWFENAGRPLFVIDAATADPKTGAKSIRQLYEQFRATDPTRDIYVINTRETFEIHDVSGEVAYLRPATGRQKGSRHDPEPPMILRPSERSACFESTSTVEDVVEVLDLDGNGISEIVFHEGSGSGGHEVHVRILAQIDECTATVLHKIVEEDNKGTWGKHTWKYAGNFAEWEFIDINGDGVKDLRETRIFERGRENREPVVTREVYRYVFINNAFIRYLEYLRKHPNRN